MKKIYIVILLSLWSINSIAVDAGWIDHIDGIQDNYLVKRANETIAATVFTVLQVGDSISVTDTKHSIELYLNGGKQLIKVKQDNSPFVITGNAQVAVTDKELWIWMKARFHDWQQLTKAEVSKQEIRGNFAATTISMPLLSNIIETAALIATERNLYLQWDGGQWPYTVEVKQRFTPLLKKTSSTKMIKMDAIEFAAGSAYRVQIVDNTGQFFIGGFKTVDTTQMPVDKTILNSKLPAKVSQTLQAVWLATQNNGEWIFEAYQQVAPLNYQPAQLLKKALARGKNNQTSRGIRG